MLDIALLFRESRDLGFLTDLEGRLRGVSRGVELRLGYSEAELLGRPLGEIVESGDLGRFFGGAVPSARLSVGVRFRSRSGGTVLSDTAAFPLSGPGGEPVGWFFGGQALDGGPLESREDLARRADERAKALHESEEKFRRAFESGAVGMCLGTPEGRFLRASGYVCRMLGYTEEELRARTFMDVTHPDDLAATVPQFRAALEGGPEAFQIEKRYVRKGGGEVWAYLSSSLVRDPSGKPLYFVTQILDITERKRAEEALRESEARFRAISEATPIPIVISRLSDGTLLFVNEAAARGMSILRDQAVGRKAPEFYGNPEERDGLVGRLRRGEGIADHEMLLRRPDGAPLWVSASLRSMTFQGEPAILGAYTDITSRKRAEETLRQSEERFRLIAEASPVAMAITRADGTFLYVNERAAQVLRLPVAELVGKRSIGEFYASAEDRPVLREKLFREGGVTDYEFKLRRADGSLGWGLSSLRLTTYQGETAVIGSFTDLTAFKEAQEELRRAHDDLERRIEERTSLLTRELSERRQIEEHLRLYREIFAHATDGILILDRDGRFLEQNEAQRRLLGYSDEELRAGGEGLPLHGLQEILERARREGTAQGERVFRAKDGRAVQVELSAFALRGSAGEALCLVTIQRDVTSRRETEEALRRIVEGTASATGEPFIRSLVRHLASALGMKYAFLARLVGRPPARMRTLAFWAGGEFRPDLDCDLRGTPCDGVAAGLTCVYPEGVARRFPDDPALVQLGAESYMGVPFVNSAGEVTGYVAVLDDRPLSQLESRTAILKVFAARAGAELERLDAEEALRASEERWRSLVVNAPGIIMTVDRGGRIASINRVIPGYRMEVVVGSDAYAYLAEPEGARMRAALEHVFRTGQAISFEVSMTAPDGHRLWWDSKAGPVTSKGEVVAAVIVATDITARKEAEEKLASLAEEQSLLLAHSRDFVYRHDLRGVFTYISPVVEQITGYSVQEWMTHYTEFLTESPLNQKVIEYTEETLRTGQQSPPYLVEIFAKGGKRLLLEVNERAYHEGGRIAGIIGIARDITDRWRAQEEIRFQKTLLESQAEASIDGILVVSTEGKMISFNRRFVEMWRIPPEVRESRSDDAALRFVLELLVDPEGFLARVRYLYDHPYEESRDEISLKDGRTFDRYSAPVRSEDGDLYGRVWYFRDVTGRKRTEVELRRAAEETRRAYEELKEAQARLIRSEKLASIGMLVSGVAHEINNPLNVMYGNLQLLAEVADAIAPLVRRTSGLPRGVRRFRAMVRDALKAARHAKGVVEDFRGFARDVRTAEEVDLNRCLEESVTLVQPHVRRGIRVVRKLGKLPPVRCLRGQVSQVFLNLIKNAAEAIEKGPGTITLRTRPAEGHAVIEVSDTGRGMSEEVRRKLFEPFFTTKPVGKGLGLGLSISAMIVHNHGGRITVESRPGGGSLFRVELPFRP